MTNEIEKIGEELIDENKKDVEQNKSIDPNVKQHMEEMGYLWDTVQRKIHEDKICFECKKALDFDKETPDVTRILEAKGVEKGVVAFVGVCDDCFDKKHKEYLKSLEDKEKITEVKKDE